MDFLTILNGVKNYCSTKISDVAYKCWIEPIEPIKLEKDAAVLFIRSEFQRNLILEKYGSLLSEGFNHVLGFDVQLKIICESDIEDGGLDVPSDFEDYVSTIQKVEDAWSKAEYDYTFDTFIVGPSNNFAYAACRAVAQSQTGAYNPLFVYGSSGLGKTHLMLAIANELHKNNPNINIIYVSAESFTNEFIDAVGRGTTQAFHSKYRSAEVLLVDDVQFLAGKERVQEEFFHTFNDLHQLNKQIVLTSDRPPKDIKTLEDRLKTRFEWGLLTDISQPEFETRMAIMKRKAELLDIDIPNDVCEFIANRLKDNIRQLEGAVKKIKAFKLLAGSTPSIGVAQSVIRDILNDNQPEPVTVDRIITEVAKTYAIDPSDIRSGKRSAQISNARQVAMYVVREITKMPLKSIGDEFGGRDHSTLVYTLQKVEEKMENDRHYKEIISDIIHNIRDN